MRNFVVLRRSPDWPTFDLEQSRSFCSSLGLPETAVIDFAARWDRIFETTYLRYRQAMKEISLDCARRVRDALVIDHGQVASVDVTDEDLFYFTDDDDWVAPELFEVLRGAGATRDGWLWSSPGLASRSSDDGTTHTAVLEARRVGAIAYTNNYAVSGAALRRLRLPAVLEHFEAQQALDSGTFAPATLDRPLSAANKHLCCVTFLTREFRGVALPSDLRATLAGLNAALPMLELPPGAGWMAPPLALYAQANDAALS